MKIAITSTGPELSNELDPRFGRCAFFLIIDTENDSFEAFDNENLSAAGGAGPGAANFVSKKGVSAVVSGNFGPNASMVLKELGIETYTSKAQSVQSALEAFKAGTLEKVSGPTVDGHHG